ncbi:MAG: hypothetical protein R3300_01395 [Candidatus Promineifilaceae bacterium]|nr:hypothetical protein [Candidatus Promineifilaceae bacterium]
MSQLDWQTDQAASWEKPPPEPPTRAGLPWRWYLLLLVGLLALVAGVYWLVTARGSEIEVTAAEELLDTHRLVERARVSQDPELLALVLDEDNPEWAATQRSLLREGVYYDRPSFGLSQVAVDPIPGTVSPTVTVGADLSRATVLTEVSYEADRGQGLSLAQTTVYRRREGRWLLSPPGRDFWGRRANFLGQHILLSYPGRDARLAQRLGADLDGLLGEFCQTLAALDCPANLYMRLTLETEPTAVRPTELWELLVSDSQLRLPAPTLVGLPLDESGYQALRRGYARQLLTTVISRLTGYRCCRHGPYYRALLDEQLARLGLAAEPLADRTDLPPEHGLSLSVAGRFWGLERVSLPAVEVWPAYALVDFLVQKLNVAPMTAQQLLASGGGLSYWGWLRQLAGPAYRGRQQFERRWQRFIEAEFAEAAAHPARAADPPVALDQNLYLLCQPDEQPLALYHYDLGAGELERVRSLDSEAAFMIALADDQGVVVAERSSAAGPPATVSRQRATDTFVWRPDREWLLSSSVADILPVTWFPTDLVVFDRGRREYGLMDPVACARQETCRWDGFGGMPILGPNQEQLLVIPGGTVGYESRFRRPIFLGGLTGEILGAGQAPFWIDEGTVGYLADEGQVLTRVEVDGAALRASRILTAEELLAKVRSSDRRGAVASRALQPVQFVFAETQPDKPETLLVVGSLAGGNLFLFDFEPASEALSLRAATGIVVDPNSFYNYAFSPSERWMVIGGYDFTSRTASLHLHNLRTDETQTIQFNAPFDLPFHWYLDWSADGHWLSMPDHGFIRLMAPTHEYQRLIVLDELTCSAAAWTDQ